MNVKTEKETWGIQILNTKFAKNTNETRKVLSEKDDKAN